jgi:class 3 adenylate cyclase
MADAKQAICIAELCHTSALADSLGERQAEKLIQGVLQGLGEAASLGGGEVVKIVDNAVMASFVQPETALRATRGMREFISRRPPAAPRAPRLLIRAGLHWGRVIAHGRDLFGEAVNVAAQLTNLAKPDQILATGPTLESFNPSRGLSLRFMSRTPLGAGRGEMDIYQLIWEAGRSTILNPASLARGDGDGPRLELSCGKLKFEVTQSRPTACLGRDRANDLMVQGGWVSRMHARVELRRGRFVLIDQSTNGTYVHTPPEADRFLKLEEQELTGSGVIMLGDNSDPGSSSAVAFRVVDD